MNPLPCRETAAYRARIASTAGLAASLSIAGRGGGSDDATLASRAEFEVESPPRAWKPATLDCRAFAAVLGVMCAFSVALFVPIAVSVADRTFAEPVRVDASTASGLAAADLAEVPASFQ